MKWLHIIPTVNSKYGGPANSLKSMSRIFLSKGHDVEIATLDAPDSPWLVDYPAPVHALGPGLMKYNYSRRFNSWLKQNAPKYDFSVIHGVWGYHSYGAWRVLSQMDLPYFLFVHGMLDPWFRDRYPLKHLKKSLYWKLCEHKVLRDAQAVIFTTEEEKVLAAQSFQPYHCRPVIMNYGTVGPEGNGDQQRDLFLAKFPELKDRQRLLFMGRIHPKKGCDLLVEAFAAESIQHQNWHLIIAGPDEVEWKSKLQQRATSLGIADRITWTGMLSGDLKWGAFRAADGFVLPSHQENFGIAVAEALACGVPVLISDKVNIWREVEADGAGFVAPDTQDGTRRLLSSLFSCSLERRDDLRKRANECFKHRFDLNRGIESLLAIFKGANACDAIGVQT